MAGLIRMVERAHRWKRNCWSVIRVSSNNGLSGNLGFGNRAYSAEAVAVAKSPFESNILRILRNMIEHEAQYPTDKLVTKFNSFTVEERPGEMLIMLRGKFGDSEDITIRASMFDGHVDVPAPGDDSSGGNVTLLHLTLAVDISKGEDGSSLKFLCSVWPECLVVHKIYISGFGKVPAKPYFGPHFRNLNPKIQEKFCNYLDARGVNNELAVFLHDCIMNKSRIELLRWMDSIKSFVEK